MHTFTCIARFVIQVEVVTFLYPKHIHYPYTLNILILLNLFQCDLTPLDYVLVLYPTPHFVRYTLWSKHIHF